MEKIEQLRKKNDVHIYSIKDDRFRQYGRLIDSLDVSELVTYMEENTGIPAEGNIYVPSVKEMEETKTAQIISTVMYGTMPIQIGYCNGRNSTYNGFEYHKTNEINIAVSDFMLAIGHCYDISKDLTYSIDQPDVFYVEKGTVFEMDGTTLHLSPLRVNDEGFRCVVILPKGTNTPLSEEEKKMRDMAFEGGDSEARLLLQKNKWVISHPEREPLMKQGAFPGVKGPNKELFY